MSYSKFESTRIFPLVSQFVSNLSERWRGGVYTGSSRLSVDRTTVINNLLLKIVTLHLISGSDEDWDKRLVYHLAFVLLLAK